MTYPPLVLNTCVAELGLEDDTGPSIRLRNSRYRSGGGYGPSLTVHMCVAVGDRAQQQLGINAIDQFWVSAANPVAADGPATAPAQRNGDGVELHRACSTSPSRRSDPRRAALLKRMQGPARRRFELGSASTEHCGFISRRATRLRRASLAPGRNVRCSLLVRHGSEACRTTGLQESSGC